MTTVNFKISEEFEIKMKILMEKLKFSKIPRFFKYLINSKYAEHIEKREKTIKQIESLMKEFKILPSELGII